MSSATRRGGIPGPESRTGLARPAMTEAEFERRHRAPRRVAASAPPSQSSEPAARARAAPRTGGRRPARSRTARGKPAKPKRVQRMFALEEDLDKKLWLYAIHLGKDRSEVVNDLLRPLSPRWSSTTRGTAAQDAAGRPEARPRRAEEGDGRPDRGEGRRGLGVGEEDFCWAPAERVEPGLERGQAEGFEHVLPAAEAGVLGLDGGQDRLALGLGESLPAARSSASRALSLLRPPRGRFLLWRLASAAAFLASLAALASASAGGGNSPGAL